MKPQAADLRVLLNRSPAQAIAALEAKGFKIGWDWGETLDAAHARAFTVAKMARLDLLRDVREALVANLRAGGSERDFVRALTPLLQDKGWWGRQIVVDSAGGAERVQLGSPRRLRTIYQTNMQSAYMAGRAQALLAAQHSHPLWQYVAVLDASTRPSHGALHGKVFAADDPIWGSIMPPNGFNCRCRVRPLRRRTAEAEGLTVESSAGRTVSVTREAGVSRRSGEIYESTATGVQIVGRDGRDTVSVPDPGFAGSPLSGHLIDELLLARAREVLGDAGARMAVRDVLAAPARQAAWRAFIDNTLDSGLTDRGGAAVKQGQTATLALLSEPALAELARRGIAPVSGLVVAEDRLLVGRKARRHQREGQALSRAEWYRLPQRMDEARLLWDVDNATLLHVLSSTDGQIIKVAVEAGARPLDLAVTVRKVAAADIEGGVRGGLLEEVE